MSVAEIGAIMMLRPDFDPSQIEKAMQALIAAEQRKNQDKFGV